MIVIVIVIACVVSLAALVAVVVLLFDRNATLRTVELKAQAWKSINIAFRIVRDAKESEHVSADTPAITDTSDADTASKLTTAVNGQFVLPVGGQMLSPLAVRWISPTTAR
ncbi:hypothetical protein AB0C24_29640 [Amycolatopsis japonica]|uniref:hypothetical protein n=1 Tax=Amycolatopsis japonica TaxID=208439 RepID=UPI0033DF8551